MFASGSSLQKHVLPQLSTRKALVIVNLQNDLFYTEDNFSITKNRDILPHVREIIPHFRKIGDIIWIRTEAAALETATTDPTITHPTNRSAAIDFKEKRRKGSGSSSATTSGQRIERHNAPTPSGPNIIYPSSREKQLMARIPSEVRARKRYAQATALESEEHEWKERYAEVKEGQKSNFCVAGTRGAEICDELKDLVEDSDLTFTKNYYSAFDQTSLLMSLRMNLITEVYLCGCLTNTAIYTTAADAVQHGLQVNIIEDCLGYRNRQKHDEAIRQMADVIGVNEIDSRELIEEANGSKREDIEDLDIDLQSLLIHEDVGPNQASFIKDQIDKAIIKKDSALRSRKTAAKGQRSNLKKVAEAGNNKGQREPSKALTPQRTGRKAARRRRKDIIEVGDTIGSGDSELIYDAMSFAAGEDLFEELRAEVDWQKMYHRSGEVPRLVAVQGEKGSGGEVPIYRHPADESPPLRSFTPKVQQIRQEVERILSQPFNHVLIQLYREGNDNISEHSDKVRNVVTPASLRNSRSRRHWTWLESHG